MLEDRLKMCALFIERCMPIDFNLKPQNLYICRKANKPDEILFTMYYMSIPTQMIINEKY